MKHPRRVPAVAHPMKRPDTIHHRFKIQRQVTISGTTHPRDRARTLGVTWRTIGEADSQPAAETIMRGHRIDEPKAELRIAEQAQPGGTLRPIP